jgi:hypothetical protein
MADLLSDGMIRVEWLTACANIAAPTVAERSAGLNLTPVMTPDGLKTDASNASVDNSSLASTYDTELAGRAKNSNSVKFKKQDSADTVATTLTFKANGFLVVRRNVATATAPTIGDKCEVYPSQCGIQNPGFGPNTIQTIEVALMNSAQPNLLAVTA